MAAYRSHVATRADGTRTINLRDAVRRQIKSGKFEKWQQMAKRIKQQRGHEQNNTENFA